MDCHCCGLPDHQGQSCDYAVSVWTRENGLTSDQARVILLQQKKRAEQERAARIAGVGLMPMWPTRVTHAAPEPVTHAMTAAQRRAKWRQDHKELHAEQQRAYRKRRAAKQR